MSETDRAPRTARFQADAFREMPFEAEELLATVERRLGKAA